MDDDSKLLESVEKLRAAVGMILGYLSGPPGLTPDVVGIATRLKLNHDELKLIRSSVQSIGLGVFVIAIATVAYVWHHW
jgi:hypothetical protein